MVLPGLNACLKTAGWKRFRKSCGWALALGLVKNGFIKNEAQLAGDNRRL